MQSRVTFTGLLRDRERIEALVDAAVLVYPSQDEIFGIAALGVSEQGQDRKAPRAAIVSVGASSGRKCPPGTA